MTAKVHPMTTRVHTVTHRIALSALVLCLPLAPTLSARAQDGKSVGSPYADVLLGRVRVAAKTLREAQQATEVKKFHEAGGHWATIAKDFADTRLLPDWAVQDADFFAAESFAQAGDTDAAFAHLEKALVHWPWHNNLQGRPTLTSLHTDQRWKPFVARWDKAQKADLSPTEKIYGLTRFWQEAKESFAYFERVPTLDWDRAYREYIPKVLLRPVV